MQEIRNQHNENINAPNDNESRLVQGYAIVFNSESVDLGGFTEIIEPDALDGVIERSDILCLLNHSTERGVLARCKNGEGSLKLEVDEHGLKYEFEAPKTALGDEILEGIRRGDISKCSFGFTVEDDEWIKREDGTVLRRIKKIKQLYDVSLVYSPAYEETEVKCDKRGLYNLYEKENISNNMAVNKRAKRSNDEILEEMNNLLNELKSMDETVDEEVVEDTEKEPETEVVEDVKEEETTEEEREETEEVKEEVVDETTEEKEEIIEENNKENRNINSTMKFSLIQTINDVVNNRGLNDAAKAVNKEGRSAMQKAGLAAKGNITLPVEMRAEGDAAPVANGIMATVPTQGKEAVATDKLNILEPLRANMVLAKAGATYMTGLQGDVSIPVYSGSNVGWKGEVIAADNGEGEFSEVLLQPKKLTAFIEVSSQFLTQTQSLDAEEMLKRDIINAIGEKLEQTILGTDAGTNDRPEGVFNGVTADTAAVKFGDIVDMEAELEDANVNDYKYIVSPTAKAILRKTSKDNGSGQFIMADGEIEGREVYVSSAVAKKGVIVGDFKDYVIAQWGGLDLLVDPYTKAKESVVTLIVTAFFDAKPRRQSFVKRVLK